MSETRWGDVVCARLRLRGLSWLSCAEGAGLRGEMEVGKCVQFHFEVERVVDHIMIQLIIVRQVRLHRHLQRHRCESNLFILSSDSLSHHEAAKAHLISFEEGRNLAPSQRG